MENKWLQPPARHRRPPPWPGLQRAEVGGVLHLPRQQCAEGHREAQQGPGEIRKGVDVSRHPLRASIPTAARAEGQWP